MHSPEGGARPGTFAEYRSQTSELRDTEAIEHYFDTHLATARLILRELDLDIAELPTDKAEEAAQAIKRLDSQLVAMKEIETFMIEQLERLLP